MSQTVLFSVLIVWVLCVLPQVSAHVIHHSPVDDKVLPWAIRGNALVAMGEEILEDGSMECHTVVELEQDGTGRLYSLEVDGDATPSFHTDDHVLLSVVDNGVDDEGKPRLRVLDVIEVEPSEKKKSLAKQHANEGNNKAYVLGVDRVIIIRVGYLDIGYPAQSASTILGLYQNNDLNVREMYADASHGRVQFPDATVVDVLVNKNANSAYSCTSSLSTIRTDVHSALLSQHGLTATSYDLRIIYTKAVCSTIGIAYILGGDAFLNSGYPDTLAHEIGHNFGLYHSGTDMGDDGVIENAYGDLSCTMGYSHQSLRSFSVVHRIGMGFIPKLDIVGLYDECAPQSLRIGALSSAPGGNPHAVMVPKPGGGSYFISTRVADVTSYDLLVRYTYAPTWIDCVYVHRQSSQYDVAALVAVLKAGEQWTNPANTLTVGVTTIGTDYADITVRPCTTSLLTTVGTIACGGSYTGSGSGYFNLGFTLASDSTVTFSACQSGVAVDMEILHGSGQPLLSFASCLRGDCQVCPSASSRKFIQVNLPAGRYIAKLFAYGTYRVDLGCQSNGPASPTASPTIPPSVSRTRTPAPTPSRTRSVPASASTTPTAAATPSRSRSVPAPASTTPTAAATPSRSRSVPASASTTPTAAATPSRSRSVPASASSTRTAAATRTPSPTPVPSPRDAVGTCAVSGLPLRALSAAKVSLPSVCLDTVRYGSYA